jgi:hypothetical protein
MRKSSIGVLCFMLAWTSVVPAEASAVLADASGIHSKYPNARVIRVSPEDYPAIESTLKRKGYQLAGEPMLVAATDMRLEANPSDGCEETGGSSSDDSSVQVVVNVMDGISHGNGNDNAVVFVIVGAVVLVVWTLYAVKYLYDVAAGIGSCGRWSEFVLSTSAISADSREHAQFAGLRYLTGFRDGATDVGIAAEVGYVDMFLAEVDSLELRGAYWMIGPLVRWHLSDAAEPTYFQMEFLAGSTEHREMGLLAQAKAGFSFGFASGFRLGVSLGTMNVNLHDTEGILSDESRYYSLFGLDFGYRF